MCATTDFDLDSKVTSRPLFSSSLKQKAQVVVDDDDDDDIFLDGGFAEVVMGFCQDTSLHE